MQCDKVIAYIQNIECIGFVAGFTIDKFSNTVMLSQVKPTKAGKPSKKPLYYLPDGGDRVELFK